MTKPPETATAPVETSIVVRTFNEAKRLPNLLDALDRQTYRDFEVVVVDSGSFDRTRDIAAKRADRLLRISSHDFTFGFSLDIFLHCLDDVTPALKELKRVLTADGTAALTTLVMSSTRWSDGYLRMLAGSGALVPRSADQLLSTFSDMGMPIKHHIKGNLAFINYMRKI